MRAALRAASPYIVFFWSFASWFTVHAGLGDKHTPQSPTVFGAKQPLPSLDDLPQDLELNTCRLSLLQTGLGFAKQAHGVGGHIQGSSQQGIYERSGHQCSAWHAAGVAFPWFYRANPSTYDTGGPGEPELLYVDRTRVANDTAALSTSGTRSEFLAVSAGRGLREFQSACVSDNLIMVPETCQTWSLVQSKEITSSFHNSDAVPSNWSMYPEVDVAVNVGDDYIKEIYHGPIDQLSSLVNVNSSILTDSRTYIRVHSLSKYILGWLDIIGIARDRIIEGAVCAKQLYVPEWRHMSPSLMQYRWLQNKVWDAIGTPDLTSRNLLIVIKRDYRGISNHDTVVMPLANEYAADHGLQVYVHDDMKLPSLREQLRSFSRAVMIIAAHGAGETMSIATAPGACVVEVFHPNWENPAFKRMQNMLQQHWVGIEMEIDPSALSPEPDICATAGLCDKLPNLPVDSTKLQSAMHLCGNAARL